MATSSEPQWETVEVPPVGHFIGWGLKKGQFVKGKVLDYDAAGGRDYNGKACPQIEVELTEKAASFNKRGDRIDHPPGTVVAITCGQHELRRLVQNIDPELERGDSIWLIMTELEELPNGNTVKRFSLQRARGNGGPASQAKQAKAEKAERPIHAVETPAPADDSDDIPF